MKYIGVFVLVLVALLVYKWLAAYFKLPSWATL